MSGLSVSLWIASGILAALYMMVGAMKAMNPAKAQAMGPTLAAQALGKLRFIGMMELLGALGIILPVALDILPELAGVAALGLVAIQGLAIPAHIKHHDTKMLPMNVMLLMAAAFVALGRFDVF